MNTSKEHDAWADHDVTGECNGVCEYCPEFGSCEHAVCDYEGDCYDLFL